MKPELKEKLVNVAAVLNNLPQDRAELMVEYELARLMEQYRSIDCFPDDNVVYDHMLFVLYNKATASIQDGMITLYKTNDSVVIDFSPRYWAMLAAKNGFLILPPVRESDGSITVSAQYGDVVITRRYRKEWIDSVLDLIRQDGIDIGEEFVEGIVMKNFVRVHALDTISIRPSPSVVKVNGSVEVEKSDVVPEGRGEAELKDVAEAIKEAIIGDRPVDDEEIGSTKVVSDKKPGKKQSARGEGRDVMGIIEDLVF